MIIRNRRESMKRSELGSAEFAGGFFGSWRGSTSAMSLLLLTSIVVLGSVVGLVTLRDQIVQELGDLAIALESLDQSYSSSIGVYIDPGPFPTDTAGTAPGCLGLVNP